jgi:antitoxin CptB
VRNRLSIETSAAAERGSIMSRPADKAPVPSSIGSADARLKRLLWRASHRGTKELDLMIGGFARARAPTMQRTDLDHFEKLLEVPEPDLSRWLLDPAPTVPAEFESLIAEIRTFHGLDGGER